MRLLTRSELDTAKAKERAREVSEGVKLANRVDRLREVQAEEEASLHKFRTKTLATIHEEISKKATERDVLKAEVERLKKKSEDALKPITEEIKHLQEEKNGLEVLRQEVSAETSTLESTRKRVAVESRLAQREIERAGRDRERADNAIEKAAAERNKAQVALTEAETYRLEALTFKERVEKELTERDMHSATRERGCTMREAALVKDREALDKEWKLLEDRKAQFLRSQKHLQQ